MDVTTSRFPDVPEVSGPARIAPPTRPQLKDEAERSARKDGPPRLQNTAWEPRSSLKFGLVVADVDAKFEIHEATDRVIVTMYDRETGEVLRELPSRHVLDQIAAVTSRGLQVDTTS